MIDPRRPWTTTLSTVYGDADAEYAAMPRDLWPRVEFRLTAPDREHTLELVFDDPVDVLVEDLACPILDAADGARSLARPANWYYRRDNDLLDRGTGPVIYRPIDAGTVALDVIELPSEIAPASGRGRFNEDVQLESILPTDPVPVSVADQLEAVRDLGQEALAFYREHGTDRETVRSSLPGAVRDVEIALANLDDEGAFTGFDTSLDAYEELFLEHSPDDVVHGPIQDRWLEHHALDTDVIERLIDERVRAAAAETARRWYKQLTWIGGEVTGRTLATLQTDPDQRTIEALLLFVWSDNPEFAPTAVRVLGRLLSTHDRFDQVVEERSTVLGEIESHASTSEHASVRAAAIEALGAVGEERSRPVLEDALDDPDPDVRSAAERALEVIDS